MQAPEHSMLEHLSMVYPTSMDCLSTANLPNSIPFSFFSWLMIVVRILAEVRLESLLGRSHAKLYNTMTLPSEKLVTRTARASFWPVVRGLRRRLRSSSSVLAKEVKTSDWASRSFASHS